MKYLTLIGLVLAHISLANVAMADETHANETEIPTVEKDFVGAISGFDKTKIIAQFGEPAKADDIRIKGSGKVVASIWQYHFINTAADGTYYETTELDFIDDKVVQVVFLNNDGSDANDGKTYELPQAEPNM
jgi:hypothetical protein